VQLRLCLRPKEGSPIGEFSLWKNMLLLCGEYSILLIGSVFKQSGV